MLRLMVPTSISSKTLSSACPRLAKGQGNLRANYQTEMLAGKNISVLRPAEGLDFNHIALSDMTLKADSFYFCDSKR